MSPAARDSGRKRRIVTWIHRHLANPLMRPLARFVPGMAVIETQGRRTGLPRRVPVGGRLQGSSFWLVAEHGRQAGYVRNIEAQPRVRLMLRGRWHDGTAHLLPDDNVRQRLRWLPAYNSLFVWLQGTDLLTLRIDLDAAQEARPTGRGS
jgi:deazaflavin-dependent oxidoreductase (nitroreductase family)